MLGIAVCFFLSDVLFVRSFFMVLTDSDGGRPLFSLPSMVYLRCTRAFLGECIPSTGLTGACVRFGLASDSGTKHRICALKGSTFTTLLLLQGKC